MAQPSPLAPLKEIEAVTITAEDLQEDENIAVYEVYQEFETAWVEYLKTRPQQPTMLHGPTAQRITDLQARANAMSESKTCIETELKKQLNEIKKSRKDLERQYSPLLDAETAKQERIREHISTKIATIHQSMATLEETAPWLHFIQELDRIILDDTLAAAAASSSHPHHRHQQHQYNVDATTTTTTIAPPVAKPSARAILLAGTTSLADHPQQLAKAIQLDNALLRAHVKVLLAEIQRHEDLAPLVKEAGEFLTEHNVWKIMKQQQQQQQQQQQTPTAGSNHGNGGDGEVTDEGQTEQVAPSGSHQQSI
jgi:hypothetical protein